MFLSMPKVNTLGKIMSEQKVKIRKLRPDAEIPRYRHPGDSGFDLCIVETVVIPASGVKILPTGLAIALPIGLELQVRLRSSASLQTPLIIPNAPGTVDSGYRGEIGIIVRNLSDKPFVVQKGERIAQGIIAPVVKANFEECEQLPDSERGQDSYGSTGKFCDSEF